MPRVIAAILLVAVLAIGGGVIATTAYQAGLSTAVTTAAASGATVVVPAYGYGFGWHTGFGIFGFFATLFFLFIVFGLIRAIFWRGGPGRHGGWGRGRGYGHGPNTGPGGDRSPWEARAHEAFDDWHRRAHDPAAPPADTAGPATGS